MAFSSERDGKSDIYVMDVPDGTVRQVTDSGGRWPVWSPDGARIAYISYGNGGGDLFVIGADGSDPHRITSNEQINERPMWSPDGQYMLYTLADTDHHPIVDNIFRADTRSQTDDCTSLIADTASGDCLPNSHAMTRNGGFLPVWSPTGQYITYLFTLDVSGRLSLMDSNGNDSHYLTDLPLTGLAPEWSTDGQHIAFTVMGSGPQLEIYTIGVDKNEPSRLTDNSANDMNPVWSPDNQQIAFVSDRNGNREIYIMDANGSNPRRLTWNEGEDTSPAWMP
jgi:TolB protein